MRPQRESEEIDDLWEAVDEAILEEFSQPQPQPKPKPKPMLSPLKNKKVG
jgi:hypothetical protein